MDKFISAKEHIEKDVPKGARYISGRQIFDEALIDGKYICRYRNSTGQIYPEARLMPNAFRQITDEVTLQSFLLSINRKRMESWDYERFEEISDDSGFRGGARVFAVSLINPEHTVRIKIMTRLDGSDIMIRWLTVENLTDHSMGIDYVLPLSGRIFDHFTEYSYSMSEAVEEGRLPFEAGYCHDTNWNHEGDFYFEPVKEGSMFFESNRGKSGFNRPGFWLRNLFNGETFVCELGYSGNWRAKLNYTVSPNQNEREMVRRLTAEIGIVAPEGEVVKIIKPGEIIKTPAIHFGVFRDQDDEIVQALHDHVRNTILLELPDGVPFVEIEANHRGYLADRESNEGIYKDVDIASQCGVELYMIDAGWYGNEPNYWYMNQGDWIAGPWLKDGVEAISDYVHKKGMRFGLWAEIEASGPNSTLRKTHPEWQMKRNGRVCADGRAMDLANPEFEQWLTDEICRMITQYNLDMFRIDHNYEIGLGGTREEDGYILNTLWDYYEAFYRIFRTVHRKFPNVVLQNCASGGGRMDFEILRYFHNSETTDWLRAPRGLRIFAGSVMFLPPEILLRTFGTECCDMPIDTDIDAQIRSIIISRPIFRGIAPTKEEITPFLYEKIDRYIKLFKEFMRPLMKNCKVYHHTPYLKILTVCPWLVLEYASCDHTKAVACIFSLSAQGEKDNYEYLFKARGLKIGHNYKVTFLNSGESTILSGAQIILNGISVRVGRQMSSEMLLFEETV